MVRKSWVSMLLAPLALLSGGTAAAQDDAPLAEPDLSFARAMDTLATQTDFHNRTWRQGQARWDADLDKGTITFTNDQGWVITAPLQVVGTYSRKDGTFLWGWDHPSVPAPASIAAQAVQAFGAVHGLDVLTTRKVAITEEQAWELTALANYLWKGQGAYRGPTNGDTTLVYMTFGELTISKP
jgi:hypothetical protein